jgi:hypothetical protein
LTRRSRRLGLIWQHTGTNTQAEEAAKTDVKAKLTEIDGLSKKSRQGVVDDLIKAVSSVDPKLHVNVVRK